VAPLTPPSDLVQLEQWLARIATTAASDPQGAARALQGWRAAAQARAEQLTAAEEACAAALARRDALRGRWLAYRAKAGAAALDEDPVVSDALAALKERLWTAPCELGAAERQLISLARLLDHRGACAGEE